MATAYTSLLGLIQPTTGSLVNTWGAAVNDQLTQLIEDAIAGYATQSVTATDWTLTTTGGGQANQAREAILIATGAPGASRYIYAPKQSKAYIVVNNCTDQSSIILSGGPTSPTTGVEIEAAGSALCAWDATVGDFIKIAGGGGGASGTGGNQVFFLNDLYVTASYTIPTGKNSGTFGPITINSGVTVTVPDDSVWSIV
jgi:hypothetical protein